MINLIISNSLPAFIEIYLANFTAIDQSYNKIQLRISAKIRSTIVDLSHSNRVLPQIFLIKDMHTRAPVSSQEWPL
jgi:hypothetical protein